jgi:hypothetical protein
MLTTLAHNFAGLTALRFVLGGAEAYISPAAHQYVLDERKTAFSNGIMAGMQWLVVNGGCWTFLGTRSYAWESCSVAVCISFRWYF